MRALNNSAVPGFAAKAADHASPEYSAKVAQPVMQAVDAMPKAYREMVNEFGYVDVYLAWRRGWTLQKIRDSAKDGSFHFN